MGEMISQAETVSASERIVCHDGQKTRSEFGSGKSEFFEDKKMSIKTLTVIGVGLLCIMTPAQAEEKKLGATANVTYMSRLMDKGGEY